MNTAMLERVVYEMNRRGMTVDISHIFKATALEIVERSRGPVVVSCVAAQCGSDVTDEQLAVVRRRNGIVQLLMGCSLMAAADDAVRDYVDDLDRAVARVGVAHVAVGFEHHANDAVVSEVFAVIAELERWGYSQRGIQQLWHENLDRVRCDVERAAEQSHPAAGRQRQRPSTWISHLYPSPALNLSRRAVGTVVTGGRAQGVPEVGGTPTSITLQC